MPTPPSTPPPSDAVPIGVCWGPRRQHNPLPANQRIAPRDRRTTLPFPHNPLRAVPSPANDPPGTLGAADTRYDSLPPREFAGWATSRRCQLTFDGAGGVSLSERPESHRCEIALRDTGPAGRAPQVAFLAQVEGRFQIPAFIPSERFAAPSVSEATYVRNMHNYLAGNEGALDLPPTPLVVDLAALRRTVGRETLALPARNRAWYRMSMLLGRVILFDDYAVLRSDRSAIRANAPDPRVDAASLFLIDVHAHFPGLPALITEHPLPPDVAVPEPLLLRYFATYVDTLPADQRPSVAPRYARALKSELAIMLVSALAADHYWTQRTLILPDATLRFLRDIEPNFPDLVWVQDGDTGRFHLQEILDRSAAAAAAGFSYLFVRLEISNRDTTLFAFYHDEGNLARAREGEGSHGGNPCIRPYGVRPPSASLWGRPVVVTIGRGKRAPRTSASRARYNLFRHIPPSPPRVFAPDPTYHEAAHYPLPSEIASVPAGAGQRVPWSSFLGSWPTFTTLSSDSERSADPSFSMVIGRLMADNARLTSLVSEQTALRAQVALLAADLRRANDRADSIESELRESRRDYVSLTSAATGSKRLRDGTIPREDPAL